MSEKDKIKFIKLTKSQRKLLLADMTEFNAMMEQIERPLQKFRNDLQKSRVEDFSKELNIEDGFTEGEWIFNPNRLRFEKVDKLIQPDDPPPDAPPSGKKNPQGTTISGKSRGKSGVTH